MIEALNTFGLAVAGLMLFAAGTLLFGIVCVFLGEAWTKFREWLNPCYSHHDWVDAPSRPEEWNPHYDWDQVCKRCGASW